MLAYLMDLCDYVTFPVCMLKVTGSNASDSILQSRCKITSKLCWIEAQYNFLVIQTTWDVRRN